MDSGSSFTDYSEYDIFLILLFSHYIPSTKRVVSRNVFEDKGLDEMSQEAHNFTFFGTYEKYLYKHQFHILDHVVEHLKILRTISALQDSSPFEHYNLHICQSCTETSNFHSTRMDETGRRISSHPSPVLQDEEVQPSKNSNVKLNTFLYVLLETVSSFYRHFLDTEVNYSVAKSEYVKWVRPILELLFYGRKIH